MVEERTTCFKTLFFPGILSYLLSYVIAHSSKKKSLLYSQSSVFIHHPLNSFALFQRKQFNRHYLVQEPQQDTGPGAHLYYSTAMHCPLTCKVFQFYSLDLKPPAIWTQTFSLPSQNPPKETFRTCRKHGRHLLSLPILSTGLLYRASVTITSITITRCLFRCQSSFN